MQKKKTATILRWQKQCRVYAKAGEQVTDIFPTGCDREGSTKCRLHHCALAGESDRSKGAEGGVWVLFPANPMDSFAVEAALLHT